MKVGIPWSYEEIAGDLHAIGVEFEHWNRRCMDKRNEDCTD